MSRWRGWLARLRRKSEPVAPPPAPSPPAAEGGVVVVTVLGLGGEALEKVLEMVHRECRALGRKPVFVTDGADFAPFRRRRLVVEQVPDAALMRLRVPDLPWWLYEERLFALIGKRWRASAVVHFGRRPSEGCLSALNER
ncbi:MAG: hypothetical protein N2038_07630 [Geminicoccaceae bacterium]|nr:hypothetical protein [Geminicoccaceae bacterium]MCS7266657.1 hypothetical protein [Geminicoccaceae bacterium]MCX7630105.1 hypothetical protein [Geminicoccaceae bacterium]MDW8123290.1 hypothetical protein [Geminicoccaceae bacterium]MDW8340409.1 hypothetical protein [Geminicoccaceae bacterium]